MHKLVLYDLKGNIIDRRHFMKQPEESQIQTYWVESLKKHGVFILLQYEMVKYIELGNVA